MFFQRIAFDGHFVCDLLRLDRIVDLQQFGGYEPVPKRGLAPFGLRSRSRLARVIVSPHASILSALEVTH